MPRRFLRVLLAIVSSTAAISHACGADEPNRVAILGRVVDEQSRIGTYKGTWN